MSDLATTMKREDWVKWGSGFGRTGREGAEWGEKQGEASRRSKERGMNVERHPEMHRCPVVRVVEQPHDLAAISAFPRVAEGKDTHSHEIDWRVSELP